MELRFLPEFRAKNQLPDAESPSIVVKSLPSPSRALCPVRALKAYIKRTSPFRRLRRRLFLSYNTGYDADIRVSTLARWIVETI